MSAEPSWLYGLVSLASASLIAAMYLAGLVISMFRWNDGIAPRLAAIGFGLMLVSSVFGNVVFRFFLTGSQNETVFERLMVFNSATTLLMVVGWALLLFALHRAFRDAAGWRTEFPSER